MDSGLHKRIETRLDKGLSSRDIASELDISVHQVAAVKAWRTMRQQQGASLSNTDSKNMRYFRVESTTLVRASSKRDAILATQRARVPGTTVLDSEASVKRISREEALGAEA